MKRIIFCLLLLSLEACGTKRGWRFEIGVAPVSSLNNRASLGKVTP